MTKTMKAGDSVSFTIDGRAFTAVYSAAADSVYIDSRACNTAVYKSRGNWVYDTVDGYTSADIDFLGKQCADVNSDFNAHIASLIGVKPAFPYQRLTYKKCVINWRAGDYYVTVRFHDSLPLTVLRGAVADRDATALGRLAGREGLGGLLALSRDHPARELIDRLIAAIKDPIK